MEFLESEGVGVPYERAKVVILPLPYDATSTYRKGANFGPRAILEASSQLETLDLDLGLVPADVGLFTAPPPDIPLAPEKMVESIHREASRHLQADKRVLSLGGEHSVSLPLIRAAREVDADVSILQIDAHLDLRDEYEGSPFNHACVMRRAMEEGSHIVSVGIRSACEEEMSVVKAHGLKPFYARDVVGRSDWIPDVIERLHDTVYVTFDLDGLDPSLVPTTGTPVPGGLEWYPVLSLLEALGRQKRVIAADITELKPDPIHHHGEFLAATLAYKMIGSFWCERSDRGSHVNPRIPSP